MSHKFKPGQKVVCARPEMMNNPVAIKQKKGEVVTIDKLGEHHSGCYHLVEYPLGTNGRKMEYDERHFEPLIETTQQFVEVTFTKIVESVPKTCAS